MGVLSIHGRPFTMGSWLKKEDNYEHIDIQSSLAMFLTTVLDSRTVVSSQVVSNVLVAAAIPKTMQFACCLNQRPCIV